MFQNILVPFDGSDHAEHALRTSLSLAEDTAGTANDRKITVFVVQHSLVTYAPVTSVGLTQLDIDEIQKEDEKQLRAQITTMTSGAEVPVEVQFKTGDPAHEICKVANEQNYDLIVMGSRGLGTMAELTLGSVSHKVIQHAKVPVLIVK